MPSKSLPFELTELQQAFEQFTSASEKLENSYAQLKEQTEELKKELHEKNVRLSASLEEKERLERFLEGILQNLPVGIVVTDPKGYVRLANGKALEILDQDVDEIQGVPVASLEILRGVPLRFGACQEKRLGRSVYSCSVSSLNGSPDDDSGWVIMIEDLSEMVRWKSLAERQKRLGSMGEMAARIAHEIRNPLGSMELNASILLEELTGQEEVHKLASRLSNGVRTVNHTLSNLLHFAKGSDPIMENLDMGMVAAEAIDFAAPLLREKDIGVSGNYEEDAFPVLGDRILLRQALLNLILNAVDAMEPGGRLAIDIKRESVDADMLQSTSTLKVFVKDDGKGIPEDKVDRIFDPFFSTRSQGTGLGLAIVNNIMESHKGIVEVDSREGQGACFVLSLPYEQEIEYGHAADSCCG